MSTAASVRRTASLAHRGVRRAQTPFAEQRVEVETGGDAVDAVTAQRGLDRLGVVLVDLLRVVKLVVVDQVAKAGHRALHLVYRALRFPLRLVAGRDEARDHRPESPDAEARLERHQTLAALPEEAARRDTASIDTAASRTSPVTMKIFSTSRPWRYMPL